jgi:predicted phosphodiesterase
MTSKSGPFSCRPPVFRPLRTKTNGSLAIIRRLAGALRVFLCILGVSFFAEARAATDTRFSFIQLCDPQLGMTDYKEDIGSLQQAVKQINSLAPDFVLMCGDFVHKPNETSFSDFRRIMGAVSAPCYWVAGNHDLTLAKPGDALPRYRELFGRDYYSFSHDRFRFVVLNTQLLKNPVPGETETEMAWLKDELQATRKADMIPILVGHHPPFYGQPGESDVWQGLPVEPRRTLLALCDQYRVPTYLSGHTHHFVEHRYGPMDIVSGEAVSTNTDGHAIGFRLWRVQGDLPWQSTFIPLYKRTQIKPKPAYDPAAEAGSVAVCRANLRQLDAAKEAFGMQRQLPNGAPILDEDLAAVLKGGRASLVCPDHGQYRIQGLGTDPECTQPSHRLPYFYQFEEFQNRCQAPRESAPPPVTAP